MVVVLGRGRRSCGEVPGGQMMPAAQECIGQGRQVWYTSHGTVCTEGLDCLCCAGEEQTAVV
jgi:hypothetical protein